MNLLPPGDKINPADAQLLVNWRMDTSNRLQCRGGSVREFGPIGSGKFHTIAHGNGFIYNGIGAEIYYGRAASNLIDTGYDGNPLSLIPYQQQVFVMNQGRQSRLYNAVTRQNWGIAAPASAPTAAGGGQLQTTIEPFDGSTGQNTVQIAANGLDPASSPAMINDAPNPNPATNPTYAAPVFGPPSMGGPGSSLDLVVNQACQIAAQVNGSFDTTFSGGLAQDDDVFRFWIRVTDPTQINSFTVSMDDGAGGYAEIVFQAAAALGGTFFPPAKFLAQTPGGWAQIIIKRNVNLDAWSAQVANVVANPTGPQAVSDVESQYASAVTSPSFGYVGRGSAQTGLPVPPASASRLPIKWAAITRATISFDVAGPCTINLNQLEVIGNLSSTVAGAITHFISFFNIFNQDSNPSPASNIIIAGDESMVLSNIPTSPDPQVTGRFVWRIGGGISQALQVGVIPDNTSTTWGSFLSNRDAQDLGIYMPTTRDLPPAALGAVGPFFGKLLAWNTADHPARLFWSDSARPWAFPGSDDEAVGNWEDVGGDDDKLLKVILHPTLAVLYKQRSIWRMPGDPATNDAVQTDSTFGLIGPAAAVNYGSVDFIVGADGVYRYNLDFGDKISDDIDPIFKGDYVLLDGTGLPGDNYLPPINLALLDQCVLTVIQDRLRFCYASAMATSNDTVAVYHIPSARWGLEVYNLAKTSFTALTYGGLTGDGLERTLMGGITGDDGGYCYRLEQPDADDDASPIKLNWQSPFYDQGLPYNFKWYSDIEIEYWTPQGDGAASTLHVFLLLDNGARVIDLGTLSSPGRTIHTFRLDADQDIIPNSPSPEYGLRAKNWAIRVFGEGYPGGGATIYGAAMHWWAEERQANTFDTGDTPIGPPERCKEIDYLELYVTANGGTLETVLNSDLPGSVLSLRTGWGNLPAPVGRGNVRFRLPDAVGKVDGRNYRVQVTNKPTGQTMQVHQARIRGRSIGEYIDGTLNPPEYYESPEFSVAPGRVGELKDFTLDYDVSAAGGQFVLYTDLPGASGLQIRRTLPIPYQAGVRGIYVFPLEGPSDVASDELPNGQLFKVRLYPPPGGILRLHGRAEFQTRIIGTYFNGANGEIWETQPDDIFEGLAVIREGQVTLEAAGPMLFELLEELPNQDERVVASMVVDPTPTTQGRLPIYGRFSGHTKGQQIKCRISGPYICRVYEVKLFGRRLQTNASSWDWTKVPGLVETSDNFDKRSMPVRTTDEEFTWWELPVDQIG